MIRSYVCIMKVSRWRSNDNIHEYDNDDIDDDEKKMTRRRETAQKRGKRERERCNREQCLPYFYHKKAVVNTDHESVADNQKNIMFMNTTMTILEWWPWLKVAQRLLQVFDRGLNCLLILNKLKILFLIHITKCT